MQDILHSTCWICWTWKKRIQEQRICWRIMALVLTDQMFHHLEMPLTLRKRMLLHSHTHQPIKCKHAFFKYPWVKLWNDTCLQKSPRGGGGRVSRSGPWTKTGLFEAITFLRDSSKYSWSRFGDLCCLHTIPQMMLLFCEEWISIHRAWKAPFEACFFCFVLFCFFFNYCLLQRFINIQATTSRG